MVAVAAIGFGTKYAIDQQRLQSGDDLRATIMLESENYQVTGTMMSVYTNSLYQSYVSQYGQYLSYLGAGYDKIPERPGIHRRPDVVPVPDFVGGNQRQKVPGAGGSG